MNSSSTKVENSLRTCTIIERCYCLKRVMKRFQHRLLFVFLSKAQIRPLLRHIQTGWLPPVIINANINCAQGHYAIERTSTKQEILERGRTQCKLLPEMGKQASNSENTGPSKGAVQCNPDSVPCSSLRKI